MSDVDLKSYGGIDGALHRAGETVLINYTAQNYSTVASPATSIRVYVSKDKVISSDDFLVTTTAIPALDWGQVDSRKIEYTLPANLKPGTYYVLTQVDPDNTIAESDETDNTDSHMFTIMVSGTQMQFSRGSVYSSPVAMTGDTQFLINGYASDPATQSGPIFDGGNGYTLEITDANQSYGTLLFTAANSYSGLTIIDPATFLQIGNGGTSGQLGTGAVMIAINSKLLFDRSDNVVLSNNITGDGSVGQEGSGTLIVTGSIDTTAPTWVPTTLQIGNGGTTGSISGDVQVDLYGQLIFDRSDVFTYGGNAFGTGKLIQAGTGTTVLTHVNGIDNVVVNSGTLQLASGGSLGGYPTVLEINGGTFDLNGQNQTVGTLYSTGGAIQLGSGTLTVSISATALASVIAGSGMFVLGHDYSGATLTMTGNNTYTGSTTISVGTTLRLGNGGATGSITGNVVDNGSLVFNHAFGAADLVKAVISGTGSVTQAGTDTLYLAGANTYTGETLVNGSLLVSGSIAASSGVTVDHGKLAGTGVVATTAIHTGSSLSPGLLAPSNASYSAVGTLAVSGDLTLASGSYFVADVSASSSDRVTVTGATSISGIVEVFFSLGSYLPGTQYALLSSTGTLSGSFADPEMNGLPAGMTAHLSYDAHNVYLTVAPLVAHDINGDGTSDLAWQNSDGTAVIYFMNGGAIQSIMGLGNPGATWKIKASDDLSGDGKADLIWQNDDGTAVIYLMDGGTVSSVAGLGDPGVAWKIKATGDLNGDGKADIVWQNDNGTAVVYFMNGGTASSVTGLGNPGASWKIMATGDFNGDGKSDLLWQNSDGTVVEWLMNGSTDTAAPGLGNPGTSWHIRDTADFNGDGKSDILWQNDDGTTVIWFMNGSTVTSARGVGNPGSAWHIEGTGDINGDGKADITWQNSDGSAVVWLMNGSTVTDYAGVGNPGSSWHVVTG